MAEQVPLGRMIGYCGHLGKLYLDTRLREQYNVTAPQSYTLLYLAKLSEGREVMQRDLERELHLKASTVNGIVDRLEEKGDVLRLSLTEAGQAITEDFRAALEDTDRVFCAVLSAEEQMQLRDMLARLIRNLENEVAHT